MVMHVNEPMLWREHIGRRAERDIAVLLSPSTSRVSLGATQVEITYLSAWHMGSERQHNMKVKSLDPEARLALKPRLPMG